MRFIGTVGDNLRNTHRTMPAGIYPSSFKLQRCYLHLLPPVTYSSKRLGMSKLVA
ncbi:Uncharacterised protein [Serratia quinivorans]|uniref:Uncharacterized protein n=1 Tax=Serratia quinivorans TaxID=137545 RepID=A0A379YPL9_9GAMM|nr:Uncharacterised protein [Serratia quinivorans]CAI1770209.1 Uncharacterised protein [Serratia quinivorans]SUI48462.1 Uncharacterised protein [Serratia quinivorans]